MSLNQHRHSQVLETRIFRDRVTLRSSWWSQTGSNRRPHACKARALPTELWPPNHEVLPKLVSLSSTCPPEVSHKEGVVGPGRLELPTSRLSGVCSNQLSYRPLKRHVPNSQSSEHAIAPQPETRLRCFTERETKTATLRTCVVSMTNQ